MPHSLPSPEQRLDSVYQLASLVYICCALIMIAGALYPFLDPVGLAASGTRMARPAMAVVVVILCLATAWKSFGARRAGCALIAREGYVYHTAVRSLSLAWFVSLVVVVLVPELLEALELPAKFYTRIFGATLMGAAGITYLLLSHTETEEEGNER